MERVFLKKSELKKYFNTVEQNSRLSKTNLAKQLRISSRTLRDWEKGIYSFPITITQTINELYGVVLPKNALIKEESEIKEIAGKIGGSQSYKKHGNPGTLEGRRKGGKASIKTHIERKTQFKTLKIFQPLQESIELAEFYGAMMGDGGMTKDQIRITLNLVADRLYADYLSSVMEKLFLEKPSISERKRNVIELVLSGKQLVLLLNQKGLVIGNKIKQGIRIPSWIHKDTEFIKSFLRGLFDTDGSVYQDIHRSGKKEYRSVCIAYTSYSPNLLRDVTRSLLLFDFTPTISTRNRIMLRRKEQVVRFFNEIGSHNEKHLSRFKRFMEE